MRSFTRSLSIRAFVSVLFLAAGIAGCGGGSSAPVYVKVALEHEDVVLDNGLRVIVQREPAWQTAFVNVRYRVGAREDPPGKEGLAHFVEHLAFRGTKDLPKESFDDTVRDVTGDRFNAHTTHDFTQYEQHVATAELPAALFVEAQRLAYPLHGVSDSEISAERGVVENERRLRFTGASYFDRMSTMVYAPSHPYSRPVGGTEASIRELTADDARGFFSKYYRPDNATIVVVGAVDVAATVALVASYFGAIPRSGAAPVRAPAAYAGPLAADRREKVDLPGIYDNLLGIAWPMAPTGSFDATATRLAVRYVEALVAHANEESKLCDSLDVELLDRPLGGLVTCECVNPTDSAKLVAAVDEALATAADSRRLWPIGTIRSAEMVSIVHDVMSPDSRAAALQDSLGLHGNADTVQFRLLSTQAITTSDVADLVARRLAGAHRVVIEGAGRR